MVALVLMGSPGPRGKAKSRRLVVTEGGRPAAGDWSAGTLAGWEDFWGSPASEVVNAKDHAAVLRLFELRDRAERYLRQADDEGIVQVGSQGQSVLHPLVRHADGLLGEVRMLEDRFGLSPSAGLKLGLQAVAARRSLEDLDDL